LERAMLGNSEIHANIPAADLKRARRFYTETLGLTPSAEDEMRLIFSTPSGSWFQLYQTSYAGTGLHTIAQWEVDDIDKEVGELRARGVVFEQDDLPGIEWRDGIASTPAGRVAWFKDSEGNTMCIDQRA
jgi:predicted enzyme related to lactoylglutathione lyase